MLLQTRVREIMVPYLPPPVIQAIHQVDPLLEPYVGPEATVTILFSLFVSWMLLVVVRFLTRRTGRAIARDNHAGNDTILQASEDDNMAYDATVVLVGPSDAGKTRIFHQLVHDNHDHHENTIPTLMSLRANVGVAQGIRYMDWPGWASITDDDVLQPILLKKSRPRMVLVLDATQSVTAAADVFYDVLAHFYKTCDKHRPAQLFIACHKQDLKAKNTKRIQLQLRTELERLLQVNKASSSEDKKNLWWPAGEPLELDQLTFCKLYFGATSCVKGLSDEFMAYCRTGTLPSA